MSDAKKQTEIHDSKFAVDAEGLLNSQFPGGFSLRDEANAIAAWAFRNGPLEDLHAGQPSELLDDPKNSRITDSEMRTLMLHACEQIESLLILKEQAPMQYKLTVMSCAWMYCRRWER